MSLCKTCTSLPLLSLPPFLASCTAFPVGNASPDLVWVGCRGPDATSDPLGLPYHQSLEALQEAASTCAICNVVEPQVSRFQTAFAQKEKNDHRHMKGPVWEMYVARGKNQESGFMVVAEDRGRSAYVWVLATVGVCCDGEFVTDTVLELGLMIVDDDALGSVVRGRRIMRSPAGHVTVRRALGWIREEDKESGWAYTMLPERVIDVGQSPESKVSLYSPGGQMGKYAVLSYAPDATVVEKFDGTIQYIDPYGLAQAFQDAIKMTRKLGMRYLWIDAMW